MALVADLRRGVINTIAASHLTPAAIRYRLLRAYGVKLDRSVVLRTGFYLDGPNLEIGAGTFVNVGCYFDGSAPIRSGAECDIAAEVMGTTVVPMPIPVRARARARASAVNVRASV